MLRRFNTGYEDGKYTLVAGHVEDGESFVDCIIREADEEAGITLRRENLTMAHIVHRLANPVEQADRIDVFFVADKWEREPHNKEPHKCDDLSWFDRDNLPENMLPYVKQAIECVEQGIVYSEFGYA